MAKQTVQKPDIADCPVARTLSVIGSNWTCLILRDLLLHGERRFQDLQDSLEGIAPTTLSERLRTLEAAWRRGAAFLFDEPAARRISADRQGSRPRPDCRGDADLGTQIHALNICQFRRMGRATAFAEAQRAKAKAKPIAAITHAIGFARVQPILRADSSEEA